MTATKTSCALLWVSVTVLALSSRAEDVPDSPTVPSSQASSGVAPKTAASLPAPGRPRGQPPGATPPRAVQSAPEASVSNSAGIATPAASEPSFVAEEKWGMAGYNNNEPIYTILLTSHDPRILRCTADLKGTAIEAGEKEEVSDRQTVTVFPNSQVQMGNWSGMDQQSGATYTVKCRPV